MITGLGAISRLRIGAFPLEAGGADGTEEAVVAVDPVGQGVAGTGIIFLVALSRSARTVVGGAGPLRTGGADALLAGVVDGAV